MDWPLLHPRSSIGGRRFGTQGRSEIPENLKNDDAKFDQQNEPPGAHWEHFFGHRGGDPNGGHTTRVKHEELTQIYRSLRKTRGLSDTWPPPNG